MFRLRALVLPAVFACAGLLSVGAATLAVGALERSAKAAIEAGLAEAGLTWAQVEADGMQIILSGTTASEAGRFRALSIAGTVTDPSRVIDQMVVEEQQALLPPRFSLELLRNDDGVSLIGLVPMQTGGPSIRARVAELAGGIELADMLESANHPVPDGWNEAVAFGLQALELLPRSKVSVAADRVSVTAITESRDQQRRLEAQLRSSAPPGVRVALDISAPRPVIAPFTLRFVIDPDRGARFDACAADTEAARDRIMAAARAAGVTGMPACVIGLGAPSSAWGQAAALAIAALHDLGEGSVTMADADVSLVVPHGVSEESFDTVSARLDRALPSVFSLAARRLDPPPDEAEIAAAPEFIATLSSEGQVLLRGRLPDERIRDAAAGFARARFGTGAVTEALRLDPDMPEGWPRRILAGVEALAELDQGVVIVRAETIELRGRSGNRDSSDMVSRIFTDKLGRGQDLRIDVVYDESLDPIAALPTPESCVADIGAILEERQITFEPGETGISGPSATTLDRIADVLRDCGDLPLEIGGHTDSQGRAESNLALSQRRAEAVLEGLLARRVLVSQMRARGYGETRPIADNATASGREANRRIEFLLIDPDAPELTPGIRPRDPELEATLEIPVTMVEDDTPRPVERPQQQ